MFFGKIKDTKDEWGFDIYERNFDFYTEIDDDTHMDIVNNANQNGKIIKGDKFGRPILVDPPPPSTEEINKNKLLKLKNYLEETDWYVIRFSETSIPIPNEIKQKRQEAREEISMLQNTLNSK